MHIFLGGEVLREREFIYLLLEIASGAYFPGRGAFCHEVLSEVY